jgi:hypothetical protein
LSDFNIISYVGRLWCPVFIPDIEKFHQTMLIFCHIVVAILKIVTGRNFSMSRINSGHHYLPTYQIVMISDFYESPQYRKISTVSDIITIWYVGR